MGVRVRVRIKALISPSAGASVETSALANTGYEAESPEVLLPRPLSDMTIEALGILILRPAEGLWRHASDSENTVRRSARPEFW